MLYFTTKLHGSDYVEQARNPEEILRPYLETVLRCIEGPAHSEPAELFSAFFTRIRTPVPSSSVESLKERHILVCPDLISHVADTSDVAAVQAEALFRQALECLGLPDSETPFWAPSQSIEDRKAHV